MNQNFAFIPSIACCLYLLETKICVSRCLGNDLELYRKSVEPTMIEALLRPRPGLRHYVPMCHCQIKWQVVKYFVVLIHCKIIIKRKSLEKFVLLRKRYHTKKTTLEGVENDHPTVAPILRTWIYSDVISPTMASDTLVLVGFISWNLILSYLMLWWFNLALVWHLNTELNCILNFNIHEVNWFVFTCQNFKL